MIKAGEHDRRTLLHGVEPEAFLRFRGDVVMRLGRASPLRDGRGDKGDKDSANATQRPAGPADHGTASSARAENFAQCYATVNQRSTNG